MSGLPFSLDFAAFIHLPTTVDRHRRRQRPCPCEQQVVEDTEDNRPKKQAYQTMRDRTADNPYKNDRHWRRESPRHQERLQDVVHKHDRYSNDRERERHANRPREPGPNDCGHQNEAGSGQSLPISGGDPRAGSGNRRWGRARQSRCPPKLRSGRRALLSAPTSKRRRR